jgi:hypothetical protein
MLVKILGHDEAKHRISEELESLVAVLGGVRGR